MDGVARCRPEHDVKLPAWPPILVAFFLSVMEMKFAQDQVLCTTLRYDAFTDDESMIGDAIRIQRTPRSMLAACSLTQTWSKAPAPRCRVTGSEHLGTHSESRDTVWTPAEDTDLIAGVEILRITKEIVRLYICHFHGYPSSLVWYLLFPKNAPDLSGIEFCAIDVTSKCGLSLAARDTVEPEV